MTMSQQVGAVKVPNSNLQIPEKLQNSMFKRRCAWNLKIEIFWGLVLLPPSSKYQKEFVIRAAALIFRALCRKQSRAAKPKKRLGKDSRSPLAAKFYAANRHGVICFRPKTRSASGTSAKWRGSIKPTKPGSKRTSRSARSRAGGSAARRAILNIKAASPPRLTSSKGLLDPPCTNGTAALAPAFVRSAALLSLAASLRANRAPVRDCKDRVG